MANRNQFNVGIVGYGLSAKVFHIPFVACIPSLTLHSIVQRSPSAGNSAPADYPTIRHHTTTDPLLEDPDVHVVILCTPPDTHFALAKKALENGKHVLVEKPFVPTSSEADELVALARAKGLVLCVYQNRRWDVDFLTVQKLLRDGTLGRVLEFETHFDRYRADKPTSWKGELAMAQGGGVVFDLGSHLLDQVYVLFGKPTSVSAKFLIQREGRIVTGEGGPANEPDSVSAVLSFGDTGMLAYVRIGVMSAETSQMRYWIRGSTGSYHKTDLDPQEDYLRTGGKITDAGFGKEDPSRYGRLCVVSEGGKVHDKVFPSVEPETYLKFYELFAKSLETGIEQDVPVPGSQAADVLRIIEAIIESAKTGRDVAL